MLAAVYDSWLERQLAAPEASELAATLMEPVLQARPAACLSHTGSRP